MRIAPLVSLLVLLSTPAFAGPLENGVQAYNKADYATAMKILEPLAQQGNADAQYTVSLMYSKGLGTTQDSVKAYVLLDQMAKAGDTAAADDRDALASGMKPEQLAEAKQKSADWKSK
jgi:TPR repeat protein